MKKLSLKITFILFLACNLAIAQSSSIKWGQKVLINNVPVSEAGKTEGGRAAYGSEYGRMLKLTNGTWLAAYTVSRDNGYQKDPNGGLELEISKSEDNGRHWEKVSVITDRGRDLDNAQLIQLPDKSVLLACRSVRWQESYRLPVYRSANNGRTWEEVYQYASNPENFPKWVEFIKSMTKQEDLWIAKTDLGVIKIKWPPPNDFGIIDHQVTFTNGETVNNPMKVVPNNKGCEFTFTLFWMPNRTEKEFNEDASAVMGDLQKLKKILEH